MRKSRQKTQNLIPPHNDSLQVKAASNGVYQPAQQKPVPVSSGIDALDEAFRQAFKSNR